MECPKCGFEVSDNSETCYNCDAVLIEPEPVKFEIVKPGSKGYGYRKTEKISNNKPPYPQYPYPPPYPSYPGYHYYPPQYYKQTHYPGLYQEPPQDPKLRLDLLFKILFWPKKAFRELYHQTTLREGIIIFILITIFSALVNFVNQLLLPAAMFGTYNSYNSFNTGSSVFQYIIPFIALPLGLLMLYLTGWLSAKFSKSIGRGFGDVDKTIGLFGYAAIVGLVIGLIQLLMIGGMILARGPISEDYGGSALTSGNTFVFMAFMFILIILSFFWGLYVYGSAISVANDVSLGEGMVSYFIASLIIGIISVVIMVFIMLATFMSTGPAL